jgi:hypothetical protein
LAAFRSQGVLDRLRARAARGQSAHLSGADAMKNATSEDARVGNSTAAFRIGDVVRVRGMRRRHVAWRVVEVAADVIVASNSRGEIRYSADALELADPKWDRPGNRPGGRS